MVKTVFYAKGAHLRVKGHVLAHMGCHTFICFIYVHSLSFSIQTTPMWCRGLTNKYPIRTWKLNMHWGVGGVKCFCPHVFLFLSLVALVKRIGHMRASHRCKYSQVICHLSAMHHPISVRGGADGLRCRMTQ